MYSTLFRFFLIISIVLLAGAVFVDSPSPAVSMPVDKVETVQDGLSADLGRLYDNGVFSGTVMITTKDADIFARSYGFADKAGNKRNSLDTVSDIGSVAKTFTAAAILQLVSDGALSLDSPLGDIFPGVPESKRHLTIKAILSHSSGLDNFHNETDFDKMSKQEALAKIFGLKLLAPQNEKIAYSNAGYTLLAAIVEQVSDQSFKEYVHTQILSPLGLSSTGFYGDPHIDMTRIAKGYGGSDSGETTFEKRLTWALIGQGGMVSSANDLSRWVRFIINGDAKRPRGRERMLTISNRQWLLGNFRHFSSWGALSYYAGGSTDFGYTSLVQYLPDQQIFIILLLNAYSGTYDTATHQKISKMHIFPHLLKRGASYD